MCVALDATRRSRLILGAPVLGPECRLLHEYFRCSATRVSGRTGRSTLHLTARRVPFDVFLSILNLHFIRLAFLCFCSRFDVDDNTVAAARPVFSCTGACVRAAVNAFICDFSRIFLLWAARMRAHSRRDLAFLGHGADPMRAPCPTP